MLPAFGTNEVREFVPMFQQIVKKVSVVDPHTPLNIANRFADKRPMELCTFHRKIWKGARYTRLAQQGNSR